MYSLNYLPTLNVLVFKSENIKPSLGIINRKVEKVLKIPFPLEVLFKIYMM